jgi:hypothetical protein
MVVDTVRFMTQGNSTDYILESSVQNKGMADAFIFVVSTRNRTRSAEKGHVYYISACMRYNFILRFLKFYGLKQCGLIGLAFAAFLFLMVSKVSSSCHTPASNIVW